jgi:hypothetical protein
LLHTVGALIAIGTSGSEKDRMPMTATRRELIRLMMELLHATESLVRATEENTRVSRGLRADIARLTRRAPARRSARTGGPSRRSAQTLDRDPYLRLVNSRRREASDVGAARRLPMSQGAGEPGVVATQAPPPK